MATAGCVRRRRARARVRGDEGEPRSADKTPASRQASPVSPSPSSPRSAAARDYVKLDAVGLAEAIRAGALSAEEAQRLAIEELERCADLAFLAHRFERPPTRNRDPAAPFAGVPFLLKDQLELEAHPLTLGSRLLAGSTARRTHPFVQDLLDAGLVTLGRTTMSELGFLPTTEPLTQSPTRNPWNPAYSPGGSSGGAAAAVAAGVVPIAHASDGGGSIRIPASCCGLVGLKPSRGRHAMAPWDPPLGFVCEHVVSRTVRDTAAMLDALHGPSPGQYAVPPPERPYRETARRDPPPLRIGVTFHGLYGERLHPEVDSALRAAARALEGLGHPVEEVEPPFATEELAPAFGVLWAAAAGVTTRVGMRTMELTSKSPLARALARRRGGLRTLLTLPDRSGPRIQRFTRFLMGRDADLSPSELWLAHLVFAEMQTDLAQWFAGGFDLWLTATLNRPPARIGEIDLDHLVPRRWRALSRGASRWARRGLPVSARDDQIARYLLGYTGYTPLANVTGVPALSLPMGRSEAGLPLGMQLTAPVGREDRLLALAGQWERAHPWPRLAEAAT